MESKPIEIDVKGLIDGLNVMEFVKTVDIQERKRIFRRAAGFLKSAISKSAKSALPNDPRQAYKAVKALIYKSCMGSVVSILDPKSSSKSVRSQVIRVGGVSGIFRTRKRSDRTNAIDGYWGKDRAFILRFLNGGTNRRDAFTRSGGKKANRSSISARNFYQRGASEAEDKVESYLKTEILNAVKAGSIRCGFTK